MPRRPRLSTLAVIATIFAVGAGPAVSAQESPDGPPAPSEAVSPTEATDLLEQTFPVAVAPVRATRLDPEGDALAVEVTQTGDRIATIGRDPRDGFTLQTGSEPLGITPADVGPVASQAHVVAKDVAVFANTSQATDTAIRPAGPGIETFTQARSAASPQEFSWNVSVGPNEGLVSTEQGGIAVQGPDGNVRASVSPPLAVDAGGNLVPTSLRAEGETVVLRVEHQSGSVQYPVVADPIWTTVATFDLTNGDAKELGRALRTIAAGGPIATLLAGATIPHPVGKAVGAFVAVASSTTIGAWSSRVLDAVADAGPRQHICVKLEVFITGLPPVPVPNIAAHPRTTGRC